MSSSSTARTGGPSAPEARTPGRRSAVTAAVVLALLVVTAAVMVFGIPVPPAPVDPLTVRDATAWLGGTFRSGAVQGLGSNSSSLVAVGNGPVDPTSLRTETLVAPASPGGASRNESPTFADTFGLGAPFAVAANASAWMIGGQFRSASSAAGALVAWGPAGLDDLSSDLGSAFAGGGVWAVAWNGTAWLVGGNGTHGAALVSIEAGRVVDLSPELPPGRASAWVQWLAWNGSGWLVAGEGVLGTWWHGAYSDLWPVSPFHAGGVFGADWNGDEWLVGGGAPAGLAFLRGSTLVAGPALPPAFDRWVNIVFAAPGGWMVGGRGTDSAGGPQPELVWVADSGAVIDLSTSLPSAFSGGEVLAGVRAPFLGPGVVVLGGIGDLRSSSEGGVGALCEVET